MTFRRRSSAEMGRAGGLCSEVTRGPGLDAEPGAVVTKSWGGGCWGSSECHGEYESDEVRAWL